MYVPTWNLGTITTATVSTAWNRTDRAKVKYTSRSAGPGGNSLLATATIFLKSLRARLAR
jgi:hypothetical protein